MSLKFPASIPVANLIPNACIAGDTYQLVEAYPADKYLPSYLILARSGNDAFHLLFAVDIEGDNVRVVTAYRPSLDEWEADLKTRRTPR